MKVVQIKAAILMGLALIMVNLKGMTQENKQKIIKETWTSEVIHVSADSLWAICRSFDNTAKWTSTLHHSYGTGTPKYEGATCSARTCETSFGKGRKVVEELTMFSDENRELAYNLIEGAPGFITYTNNHWKVIEISSNRSKLEMHITLHMKKFAGFFLGGLTIKQMKKQVSIVLDEIKFYAETGVVSEAKKKQLEKLNKGG